MVITLFIFLILSTGFINGERVVKLITNRIESTAEEELPGNGEEDEIDRGGQILAATNIEEIFDRLVNRYRDKLRQRLGARMLSTEIAEKEIMDICGTSSSVTCGNAVVGSLSKASNTIKRCQARKNFLNCIDIQRKKCRDLAEDGFYPTLPSKSQIKVIQENAWKTLWTSGGCVLEA